MSTYFSVVAVFLVFIFLYCALRYRARRYLHSVPANSVQTNNGYHNQQHQIPTIYTINTQTNVNRTQEQIAYDELMIQHAAEIESYKMAQQRNKYWDDGLPTYDQVVSTQNTLYQEAQASNNNVHNNHNNPTVVTVVNGREPQQPIQTNR